LWKTCYQLTLKLLVTNKKRRLYEQKKLKYRP
jgi:hypothetical protein